MLGHMPNPDGPDIRTGDAERERAVGVTGGSGGRTDHPVQLTNDRRRLRSRIRADLRDVLLTSSGDQISALFGVGVGPNKPGHWSDPLVLSAG